MNNIENQAKDEVRELLKDLVVSPVSSDLKNKITEVTESLSELQNELKELNVIKGLISGKVDNLGNAFNGNLSSIQSSVDACENYCKKIKPKTEKLDDIQSKVIESLSRLTEAINEFKTIKERIPEDFAVRFEKLSSDICNCQSVFDGVKKQLFDTISTCSSDLNLANGKLDEMKTTLSDSNERIGYIDNNITNQMHSFLQNIDNKSHSLIESIDDISISIEKKKFEISEEQEHQYKQNKIMILSILVLSVINLVGLLGLIIFHFIR